MMAFTIPFVPPKQVSFPEDLLLPNSFMIKSSRKKD